MDVARSAATRSGTSYRRVSAGARARSPAAARTARSTEVGTPHLPPKMVIAGYVPSGRKPCKRDQISARGASPRRRCHRASRAALGGDVLCGQCIADVVAPGAVDVQVPARGTTLRGTRAFRPRGAQALFSGRMLTSIAVQPAEGEGVVHGEGEGGRDDALTSHPGVHPVAGVGGAERPPDDVAEVIWPTNRSRPRAGRVENTPPTASRRRHHATRFSSL